MSSLITIAESQGFRVQGELGPKQLTLKFTGRIDENLCFTDVSGRLGEVMRPGETLILDLGGVESMNSVGTRSFGFFLRDVQEHYEVRFSYLSEAVVEQANMVPGVLGDPPRPVLGFEVPYICPTCGTRSCRVFRPSDLPPRPDGSRAAPSAVCDKCMGALEFDSHEDEYFAFLEASS